MANKSRWMTWVLEDSAKCQVTMPWARGTQPKWKKKLAVDTPELAMVLDRGLALAKRSADMPQQATT